MNSYFYCAFIGYHNFICPTTTTTTTTSFALARVLRVSFNTLVQPFILVINSIQIVLNSILNFMPLCLGCSHWWSYSWKGKPELFFLHHCKWINGIYEHIIVWLFICVYAFTLMVDILLWVTIQARRNDRVAGKKKPKQAADLSQQSTSIISEAPDFLT